MAKGDVVVGQSRGGRRVRVSVQASDRIPVGSRCIRNDGREGKETAKEEYAFGATGFVDWKGRTSKNEKERKQ